MYMSCNIVAIGRPNDSVGIRSGLYAACGGGSAGVIEPVSVRGWQIYASCGIVLMKEAEQVAGAHLRGVYYSNK